MKFITWLTEFEEWCQTHITATHDCAIWWIIRDVVKPFKDVEITELPSIPLNSCCLGPWKNSGLDIPECSDISDMLMHYAKHKTSEYKMDSKFLFEQIESAVKGTTHADNLIDFKQTGDDRGARIALRSANTDSSSQFDDAQEAKVVL